MTDALPMLPPAAAPSVRDLVVFHDGIGGDDDVWSGLVADLARVLALEPSYTAVGARGAGWVDRLLRAAAAAPGPVLVLPSRAPGAGAEAPRLVRVVIASGDAGDVVRSAGVLSRRLRREGVGATVLVVLTDGAVPPMWEGPGHHAAAWRTELRRRHEGSDALRVLPGVDELGAAIHDNATDADTIVLVWRRVAAEGRALVVRSVLGATDGLPCLLVPMDWVAALEDERARGVPARAGTARRAVSTAGPSPG